MEEETGARNTFCASYRHAVELIGRRWTGVIIQSLLSGVTRFGDLRASVPDLSDRMLSERLKELESEGIVQRIVIPEMPVRIEYRLTQKGRDLVPVVDAVIAWAQHWAPSPSEQEATETPLAISNVSAY